MIVLRVPYPLGFYTRGLDGRQQGGEGDAHEEGRAERPHERPEAADHVADQRVGVARVGHHPVGHVDGHGFLLDVGEDVGAAVLDRCACAIASRSVIRIICHLAGPVQPPYL